MPEHLNRSTQDKERVFLIRSCIFKSCLGVVCLTQIVLSLICRLTQLITKGDYTMTRQTAYRLTRFMASGLVAVQTAIAATAISEFSLTTPDLSLSHVAQAQESNAAAEEVYRKAAPAVVFVQTDKGTGSGVIIESNGLIVTNAYVLENAKWANVELPDGRKFAAQLAAKGHSDCLDLALLKIEGANLPKVKFAAQNAIQTGQRVFAIGYPREIKPSSITQGIISNVHSDRGLIQMDASINPGNSGGALLNSRGELIGINTFKSRDDQGLNFAIAAHKVQILLQAMKEGISPTIGQYLIPAIASPTSSLSSTLSVNETQEGRLQKTGNFFCDGSRADLYTFQGEADQPILINMSSSEIGSFLMLLAPNGEVLGRDKSENRGQSAQVMVNLPQRGTYTVIANSVRPEQLGRYRLQVSTPLMVEQSKLTPTDPRLEDGSLYRRYAFSGKAGQAIAVVLHQAEFDPFVAVVDPAGKVVAQGAVKRQGVVRMELPKDGTYTLIVSTAKPGDRGQFFLSVHVPQNQSQPEQVSRSR